VQPSLLLMKTAAHASREVLALVCQRFARSRLSPSLVAHHGAITDTASHLRCCEVGRSVDLFLEGPAPP
jgi:hypothetical protein